jgi:hypothetical protein
MNINKVMNDALEISKKQGSAIVAAGLEQLKEERNERVVKFVAGLLNQISILQTQQEQVELQIKFQQDRLKAIHDGEFTITRTGQVVFEHNEYNV